MWYIMNDNLLLHFYKAADELFLLKITSSSFSRSKFSVLVLNSQCKNIFLNIFGKFPVFFLSGKIDFRIPCFPCAVVTLILHDTSLRLRPWNQTDHVSCFQSYFKFLSVLNSSWLFWNKSCIAQWPTSSRRKCLGDIEATNWRTRLPHKCRTMYSFLQSNCSSWGYLSSSLYHLDVEFKPTQIYFRTKTPLIKNAF